MSTVTLRPPAARQGPGAIPDALLNALDLKMRRLVARTLPGDRRAAGVGAGDELAQLRPYEIGDDVRHIDAAATARSGQPHVRLHVPDRTLTTWLLLDVSASMAFGTATRLKADVAEGVARVIGRLAVRRAGSVGAVIFGAGELRLLAPRGSQPGGAALRRAVGEGVSPDGRGEPHSLAEAIGRILTLTIQPGQVVVVSDFRDQEGWTRGMGALRLRHSVLAIEVFDPRERDLVAVGRLAVVDPETGEHVEVDTSSASVRDRFATVERERREEVARELRRLRVPCIELSTEGDWLRELGRRLG